MSWSLILAVLALGADPGGRIAFVSGTEQEDQCVCVLDLSARTVVRVGPGSRDGAPRWSPDGQWLAFSSCSPEGMFIYVTRADGSEGRKLAHTRSWNRDPRWSPDGKNLAYSSGGDMDAAPVLAVYDLEKNTETDWGGAEPGLMRPVWMPSLRLMRGLDPSAGLTWEGVDTEAFLSEAFGVGSLVALGMAGKPGKRTTEAFLVTQTQRAPLLQLLPGADSRRYAEWSMEPDYKGERLAYESNDGGDREIFVIDIRGCTDVTNHAAADWNPVWSPDGKWLAFESFRGGRRGVYRVFPATARVFEVAASPDWDAWSPAWSSDNNRLAFVSDQSGDPEIYLYDVAAESTRRLTEHAGPDLAPAWCPEGKP